MTVSAEGPEQVRVFTLVTLASALAMEINMPGMRVSSRGSALDAARIQHVIPKGKRVTRKDALQATVDALKELRPDYDPNRLVKKALA
jgi:hypothetical protein